MKNSQSLHTILATFLLLSGCNGTTISADTSQSQAIPATSSNRILIITQSGGCIRIGPNCAEHTLYDNGKIEVRRSGIDNVEAQGAIDTGQVTSWLNLTNATDFEALRSRLPAGICAGCFDGIDFSYNIKPDTDSVFFDSQVNKPDEAEPFFALTNGVYEAMQSAANLEIISRSN